MCYLCSLAGQDDASFSIAYDAYNATGVTLGDLPSASLPQGDSPYEQASSHGALTANSMVNGVLWDGWRWSFSGVSRNLQYFFANDTGKGWLTMEKTAYAGAIQTWAAVANITFSETATRADATLVENISNTTQMDNMTGTTGVFAFHNTPQQAVSAHSQVIDATHTANFAAGQADGFYNYQSLGQTAGWTQDQLTAGGFFFRTIAHELGHSLGLKHPHDVIGAAPKFPGVATASDLGTNSQSSMFWSIMSYNRNYSFDAQGHVVIQSGNNFQVGGADVLEYGYVKGPMAYDIAAIQALYGQNTTTGAGNTVYTLPDADAVGVGWTCIWDASGDADEIKYVGAKDTIIDLTPAKLDGSAQGGGVLSYAENVHGGYTIANGVQIEKATGGNGDDSLTGNQWDNILDGGKGHDTYVGGAGTDTAVLEYSRYYYNRTAGGAAQKIFTGFGQAASELDTVASDVEKFKFKGATTVASNAFEPAGTTTLARNDDGSTGFIDLSNVFLNGIHFGSATYNGVYINNNGNITFTGPLSSYTPGQIGGGSLPIIAPFWADVDTRVEANHSSNGITTYNLDAAHGALTVTWPGVDYYTVTDEDHVSKYNSFQMQLIDQGSGDFEIIFRYLDINWTTGDASGGTDGLGGTVARAGFSSGTGATSTYYELPQSARQGPILGLEAATGNTGVAGVWQFRVTNGVVDGFGTANADTLRGTDGPNFFDAGGGDDAIYAAGGADHSYGRSGNDYIDSGSDNDYAEGNEGNDTLLGADGDDTLYGDGVDDASGAISETLTSGAAAGSGALDKDVVTGDEVDATAPGDGADYVDGGAGNDVIYGGGANDTLLGGDGNDYINAGDGNDVVFAGPGVDVVFAGIGDDYIQGDDGAFSILSGEGGNDTIYGGIGNDYMIGGDGNDVMVGLGGQDSLYGGAGDDYMVAGDGVGTVLDGGAGANSLWGAGGADYAVGGAGNDIIVMAGGSDYLFGLDGDDTLYGGFGTDYIYSNGGNDFIYTDDIGAAYTDYIYVGGGTGTDTIADFVSGAGGDVLVVSPGSGVTTFAQLLANTTQVGVYSVITLGADQVYLYNIQPFQLTADNFLFF